MKHPGLPPTLCGETEDMGHRDTPGWWGDLFGMNFWAVSDVERGQLDDLAALWRASP
jgi:hypothetical protein